MEIQPDTLVAQRRWRRQARFWRIASVLIAMILVFFIFQNTSYFDKIAVNDHIIRIRINGIIFDDNLLTNKLESIPNNPKVHAVILIIDSPGGTSLGGETIYRKLRIISKSGKPVVAIIRTMGTSAGYTVALGADRIYALKTSLVGSVGAIIRTADLTELMKKIGIRSQTYRSGKIKSFPSPIERTPLEADILIQNAVNDVGDWFIKTTIDRRKLTQKNASEVASGRIFTGRQALNYNLIDEIGEEKDALRWLRQKKGVKKGLAIIEAENERTTVKLPNLFYSILEKNLTKGILSLDGLLSVWQAKLN